MLDIKDLRRDPEGLAVRLARRGPATALGQFLALDAERRARLTEVEALRNRRNVVSQEIARLKKSGGEPDVDLIEEMRGVGDRITGLEAEVRSLEERLAAELLGIPNVPHASVPDGLSAEENQVVRTWGVPPSFPFAARPHWEIGESLGIIDFERGVKVAGTRFIFYRGLGARLERALISFMLDLHTRHGYVEVFPPFLANSASMTGTGQLPKFAADMFHVEGTDYYLIPTAEVPVTNLYRDEILDGEQLPIRHCAYSACFRAEAGAAGRDTRGLIRQHQFNKVELVKFVRPETSYDELEQLTRDAERVLELLGIPYRTVLLCAGDMGFAAAKTYDLEVWLPSAGAYREISSCTNFEDYQARRAGIRFRPGAKEKPQFVHTLNGSGVAIGRTVAAILENYQQPDGSVAVPEVLRPYMAGATVIGRA